MGLEIRFNCAMEQAARAFKTNTGKKASAAEKLSSGYRIVKAADDAAGLAISEKMRWQIRGLNRGTRNGEDGISWVQTGDGALNEAHAILHRMTELTIQSLNDTCTEQDRAALQSEYDALQSELDRIADTTQFNTQNIFDDHKEPYYQFTGNVVWDQSKLHALSSDSNDLTISYKTSSSSPEQTVSISVAEGLYTTQELIDEIDSALTEAGVSDLLNFEYTKDGTCNLNLEGGELITDVSGGLSNLLYDTYTGGSLGSLIGTTAFLSEDAMLEITAENNSLSFTIESSDGTESNVSLTIANGYYNRSQLIDILNEKLEAANTTVRAEAYGQCIKMASDDSIITGFKGNMFRIDDGATKYTSIFYDNTKYSSITRTAAVFTGGGIVTTDSRDEEHAKIQIDSSNNTLILSANGEGDCTIVFDDGDYSVSEIVAKLNSEFKAAGLSLTAATYSTSYSGKTFQGIKITSGELGIGSTIDIDASSSAYDTLFCDCTYNTYTTVSPVNETKADSAATFTSGQTLSSGKTVVITSGENDRFTLNLTDASGSTGSYTITLDAGEYTASELAQKLNEKFSSSSAPSGYKDKVTTSVVSNKLRLSTVVGSGLTGITATAVTGNSGYEDIFVGKNYATGTKSASGNPPSVTLDTALKSGQTIEDAGTLTIRVNGTDTSISIAAGSTQDDVVNAVETAFPGTEKSVPNTFSDVSGKGSTTSNTFSKSGTGTTAVSSKSYSATGTTKGSSTEGVVGGGYTENTPASVTVTASVPANFTVDSSNNALSLTINGVTHNLTIASGTYEDAAALAAAVQTSVTAAFGTGYGSASVTASDGQLVITADLDNNGVTMAGSGTSISCNTSSSSLLSSLHTTKTAASVTTNALNSSVVIDSGSNTFQFTYTENGVAKDISLTLANGTYTRSGLISEINKKLDAAGVPVTASLSGSCMSLATDNKGSGYGLKIDSADCGTCSEALFGAAETKTSPKITLNQTMQQEIVIDDEHNTFTVKVNGSDKTVTIANGSYSRSGFVTALNSALNAAGVSVTASLSGTKLVLTGTTAGAGNTLSMTYSGGGTSMSAIYGETVTDTPKIEASFDDNGKLTLTGTSGSSFSVVSGEDSYFYPSQVSSTTSPSKSTGYVSSKKSYIDGVSLTEPIEIDKWNQNLKFTYAHGGTSTVYSVSVPEGSYDFKTLQTTLQNLLDGVTGSRLINVTVSADGVRMEAGSYGSTYNFSSFSGGFYNGVIGSCKENSATRATSYSAGTQTDNPAYTVGRKDVRNKVSVIKRGVNDELSLDFSYGDKTTTLSMTLDEGEYDGASLVKQIQEKLNEQLADAGLSENLILAGIGNIPSTGVYGANDNNALNFKLNTSAILPESSAKTNEYVIDGVSGNAAFTVFYQTDGEIDNAYVTGNKNISDGVTIEPDENELSFSVDGTEYTIALDAGTYTAEELVEEVNDKLAAAQAPLTAGITDGCLRLTHKKYGTHTITDISGPAKSSLFFEEHGSTEEEEPIHIQLSSRVGDAITIERPRMTTSFLKINSTAITQPKYANKALTRLSAALDTVSAVRTMFGTVQNRLEHALAGNRNTAENTSSAESRLRDADMAETMMDYARNSILEQAAQAMQAQANTMPESLLQLLL